MSSVQERAPLFSSVYLHLETVPDQVLSDLVITFLSCRSTAAESMAGCCYLCCQSFFVYCGCLFDSVSPLFLTMLILWVMLHVSARPHQMDRSFFHQTTLLTVMCFPFNTNWCCSTYSTVGKRKTVVVNLQGILCIPQVESKTFTSVLLPLCSNNSGTRSQPSINEVTKQERKT